MSLRKLNRRAVTFVFCGLVFSWPVPGHAQNNLVLHSCYPNATILGRPAQIVVIYWDTFADKDPNNEASFDQELLSQSTDLSDEFTGGSLIGTPYNETMFQYYQYTNQYLACWPPAHNVLNSTAAGTVVQYVSAPPPLKPRCVEDEYATVDQVATSYGYGPNTVYVLQFKPNQAFGCQSGCAYHDRTTAGNPYIALPYVTNGNSCGGTSSSTIYDVLAGDINHEYAELLTNIRPASPGPGWWGPQGEIGDPCENYPLVEFQLFPSNSLLGVSHVGLQPLWSNAANSGNGGCVYSRVTGSANFYLGTDGQIWVQENGNSSATAWGQPYGYSSGTRFLSPLAVANWGASRYDVFGYDSNGHLNHVAQNAGGYMSSDDWGGPPPTAFKFTRKPAVTSSGFARLDLFATVSSDGEFLVHRSWDATKDSGWSTSGVPAFPTTIASAPAAVAWSYNGLNLFVVGGDGNLYRATSIGGTFIFGWANEGHGSAALTGDPTADSVLWADGTDPYYPDVFLVSGGGQSLSHWYPDSKGNPVWETWPAPTGYTLTGSPTAVGMGDMRVLVTAATTSGAFVQYLWDYGNLTSTVLGANFAPVFNTSALAPTVNESVHPLL